MRGIAMGGTATGATATNVGFSARGGRRAAAVAAIPFGALVRVEWRKTVDTRAARWLLALTAALTFGGLALPLVFSHDIDQTTPSYLSYAGLGLTRLLPILLLMALTGEWSQRTAIVTFIQEPRRSRVLAAKILAGLSLAGVLAGFGWAAAQAAVALARAGGRHIASDIGHDWPRTVGYFAFVLFISLIGMAFGGMLHNTAAAIVTFFAVGGLANLFSIGALKVVGRWVNTGETYGWVLEGKWSGHEGQIVTSTLLWIVLPLTVGLMRTVRREVH